MFNLKQVEGYSYRDSFGHLSMSKFLNNVNPDERIQHLIDAGHKDVSRIKLWDTQYKKSGNRIALDLDYADFESKADYIATGNVISNVMFGSCIRPRNQLECNGRVNLPGHLQNFDLQGLRPYSQYRIAEAISKNEWFEENKGLAHVLRHRNRQGNLIVHGAIVTDLSYKPVMVFDYSIHAKSARVMELGMLLLTDKRIVSSTPVQNSTH